MQVFDEVAMLTISLKVNDSRGQKLYTRKQFEENRKMT
jgi:hypothetical protein